MSQVISTRCEGVRVRADEPKSGLENDKNSGKEELQDHAKKLSEILGINPSRKLEWPRFEEKETTSCCDSDIVKRLKKGGVPLDYIEPEVKDGFQVALVLQRDVQSELDYWQPSILIFVLGANPPYEVMNSFYRRIWKHLNGDKVILLPTRLFVIHFKTMEDRDEALSDPINDLGANSFSVLDMNEDVVLPEEAELTNRMTRQVGAMQQQGQARSDNPLDPEVWSKPVEGTYMYQRIKKLKNLKPVSKRLNTDQFNDIQQHVVMLRTEFEGVQAELQNKGTDMALIEYERRLHEELMQKSKTNVSFLQQKAKELWVKQGDSNNAYFHARLRLKTMRNMINSIVDEQGEVITDWNSVRDHFIKFFHDQLGQCNTRESSQMSIF
ncbi:OLC1v1024255C1 [Oldenlandia corymbosa var. corymbosa]|uniref:OLC1v1024255C1 n=1 Tax=Oldenlandia corymbosa var. corymbosa TaxID=529605 RepID=A0AAV1C3B2_OLDCO|nr:OLC1v1024255C1 [Oldenlandia corymbosa var. corymbosa]